MDVELAIIALLLAASVVGMMIKALRIPYTVALVLVGLGLAICGRREGRIILQGTKKEDGYLER